ncbi:hypothetical protein [Deinococcus navajonensis]|uniref:Lipoprotein n=1 Tax=Deinococcus navajonensis TaxID=309884 RepID=A0ABV8XMK8_9DEIO
MVTKVKIFLLCFFLLMSGCSATAAYSLAAFKASGFCKIYKCRTVASTKTVTKFILGTPSIGKGSELYYSYLPGGTNKIVLYLPKGSLTYSLPPDNAVMVKDLFSLLGLTQLDLKRDILASSALVDDHSTDFAEIRRFLFQKRKMVAFVKSVPDPSLKPFQGRLAYGIMDADLYPPVK